VRQLASRAREHVREARPRFSVSQDEALRLATAFMAAAAQGDMAGLSALLADDAILVSDGGGKRKAALRIMVGRADIVRLVEGLTWRGGGLANVQDVRAARINGYPGWVISLGDGPETIAFQPGGDGLIAAVYMVRNPEKLAHLEGASA
jgi:RNA polymerase sigma-70 factor (ECF subfamily)